MATRFQPVRGYYNIINASARVEGKVYFAIDTRKIYYDNGEKLIPMGGNSGIFYANKDASVEITSFSPEEFDNYDASTFVGPSVDDLILNLKDGCFYRVTEVAEIEDKKIYMVLKLTVAGSGDGGSSLAKSISLLVNTGSTTSLINGQTYTITATASAAQDKEGNVLDETITAHWSLSEKTATGYVTYYTTSFDMKSGDTAKLEIGSLMRENSTIKFSIYVRGTNSGQSITREQVFTTASLSLEPAESFSNVTLFDSQNVILQCNAVGNTDKILQFYWDGELVETKALTAASANLQQYQIPPKLATHGKHDVLIELYQSRSGQVGLKAGSLSYEIAVKGNENTPIIWTNGYKDLYYDYEIIKIPFQVYDPLHSDAKVVLYKGNTYYNNTEEDSTLSITRDEASPSFSIWEITNAEIGNSNNYALSCGEEERNVRYEISFSVEETDKLKLALQDNLVLNFDATGRSNQESLTNRRKWINPIEKYSKYTGKFSGFNWYNNGWIQDEDNQTCLRISNGASFEIGFEPMVMGTDINGKSSWTVEMQFKISNVKTYNNLITTYTRYPNDSEKWEAFKAQMNDTGGYTNYDDYLRAELGAAADKFCEKIDHTEKVINTDAAICSFYDGTSSLTGRGFCIGPQDAFFTSGLNTVNVDYVEDKMIHLALVYSYSNKLLSIYINGILTGVVRNTVGGTGGSFTINQNTIKFNSNSCDFNLYKMRIYNTNLPINYIDLNLAADQKDIDIYDQTNLAKWNSNLNEYQFDYEAMLEYNKTHPDNELMPYVVWTTTGLDEKTNLLPYSKANVIKANMEFHNVALDRAYMTGKLSDYAAKDGLTDEACQEQYGMSAVEYYYLHHCPSWHGENVEMKVQGTSSEFYPRRNYKVKTKVADADGEKKYVHMYMNEGPFAGKEKQLDWFYFDNYTVGTTKFTMKIDFMESSGSYNVGFANLVANAYTKHPLDDYVAAGAIQEVDNQEITEASSYQEDVQYYYKNSKGNYKEATLSGPEDFAKSSNDLGLKNGTDEVKWYTMVTTYKPGTIENIQDYRTSVQGFPVLAFHRRSDTGAIKYIGRYNMILDKGSDEAYGFSIKDKYQKFLDYQELPDIAECWEFSDNQGAYCSFRDFEGRRELSFTTEERGTGGGPRVADSFEYRYNKYGDYLDIVYHLNQSSAELDQMAKDLNIPELSSSNKEPAIKWAVNVMRHWEKACAWVYSTCTDIVPSDEEVAAAKVAADWSEIESKYKVKKDELKLTPPETYGEKVYEYDTKQRRLEKFMKELPLHFDIDYVATYFVMTEAFECYDSRGKNCMMASWGPLKEGGDYIWYPIFYDIDTQLGINNTGIPSFTYDIDATKGGHFSTNSSVLWNNFFTCYKDSYIRNKYRQLRGYTSGIGTFAPLTNPPLSSVEHIEKWYLADYEECGRAKTRGGEKRPFLAMKGQRPLIAINLDEYYKYITITNNNTSAGGGYSGQGGATVVDNGSYFYALQGDRSLSRQQFLTDRINFIDSWLYTGAFQRAEGNDTIKARSEANRGTTKNDNTADHWVESPTAEEAGLIQSDYWADQDIDGNGTKKMHEFDTEFWLTLTPSKTIYTSIGFDNEAENALSQKAKNTAVKVLFPQGKINEIRTASDSPQALIYIYGGTQYADLGDLSKLYLMELNFQNECPKLTRLLIGNDNFDAPNAEGVATGYYRKAAGQMNLNSMPLLEEFCLSGVMATSDGSGVTYDLSKSEKLRSFRALRTDLTGITFAEGVALHTLYLPHSIKALNLVEAKNLKKLLTTTYPVTKGEKTGEYICAEGLYIESLFGDSPTSQIDTLSLNNVALGYDSYRLAKQIIDLNTSAKITLKGINWCPYQLLDEGSEYLEADAAHYFVPDGHYGFAPYSYVDENAWKLGIKNKEIYKYDADYLAEYDAENLITNLTDFFEKLRESTYQVNDLQGIVYINNAVEVDEGYVRNNLLEAYPNMEFYFAKVNKAYSGIFKQVEDDGTYKQWGAQKIAPGDIDTSWFKNPYNEYRPKKLDYDFVGWCLSDDGAAKNMLGTADEHGFYTMDDEAWNDAKASILNKEEFDYTFYAIFKVHTYNIKFCTYNSGNNSTTEVAAITVNAGNYLSAPDITPLSPIESSLALTMRHRFLGWVKDKANCYPATEAAAARYLLDLTKIRSEKEDRVFYACFLEESVYDKPDTDLFEFTYDDSLTFPEYPELEGQYYAGYEASPARGKTLTGKVTLPATYNGKPVIMIRNMHKTKITHFFLEGEDHPLVAVGQGSSAVSDRWTTLQWFDFNHATKLKVVGASAFQGANLENTTLPPNILAVDNLGFNNAFHVKSNSVFIIPYTLKYAGYLSCSFFKGDNNETCSFQIGEQGKGTHLDIANSIKLFWGNNTGYKDGYGNGTDKKLCSPFNQNSGEFFGHYYVYVDDATVLASWNNNAPVEITIDENTTVTLPPRTFFGDEYRIANGGDESKVRVQFVQS